MLDDFLTHVAAVIHVGANDGHERHAYAEHDLSVLWIEALPSAFAELEDNLSGFPKQTAIEALVTDKAGQNHTFHVANNKGASSSIFDFALHRDIWPDVTMTHDIELTSSTLDDLVTAQAPGFLRAEALVMDTQGSELLVLKGAPRVLEHVRYIKTEAADFESYAGSTTVAELSAYLGKLGFTLVGREAFASHPKGGKYYDVLFEKTSGIFSKVKGALGF